MSSVHIDPKYDLVISMMWHGFNKAENKWNNHGISGHVYEIIDYFLLLHVHMNVCIMLCEDIDWHTFYRAIVTKYSLPKNILEKIQANTIFHNRPRIVRGKNILFVDGGLKRGGGSKPPILIFKHIFCFRCSIYDTHHDLHYKNITLLQDNRVYNDGDNAIAIHYIKKINFAHYKKNEPCQTDTAMLYLTNNCRLLPEEEVRCIIEENPHERYMILTTSPIAYSTRLRSLDNLSFPELPVKDIFNRFDTYIYTRTRADDRYDTRPFDCSPRFIVECYHYGKNVVYHGIDDSYLADDTGLKYRLHDIKNDPDSLYLSENDEIIDIIKQTINETI